MSRTDTRATLRELKADLERRKENPDAVRDRRNWGTFASRKTARTLKRAGNKSRRYRGRHEINRGLAED